jgi:hypothetical protein
VHGSGSQAARWRASLRLQDAIDCATAALAKYGIEKDVAAHIKKVPLLVC